MDKPCLDDDEDDDGDDEDDGYRSSILTHLFPGFSFVKLCY